MWMDALEVCNMVALGAGRVRGTGFSLLPHTIPSPLSSHCWDETQPTLHLFEEEVGSRRWDVEINIHKEKFLICLIPKRKYSKFKVQERISILMPETPNPNSFRLIGINSWPFFLSVTLDFWRCVQTLSSVCLLSQENAGLMCKVNYCRIPQNLPSVIFRACYEHRS